MKRAHAIGLAALLLPSSVLPAATFTVVNTADSGAGSLASYNSVLRDK